jgi:hypothetical protein
VIFEILITWVSRSLHFLSEVSSLSTNCVQFYFCQHSSFPVWLFCLAAILLFLGYYWQGFFTWKWLSWKLAPKFSVTFSSRLIFKIQLHWKGCCSTVYLSRDMLFNHWMTAKMRYQQQTWWFVVQVCYCRQQKLRYRLKPVRESVHGHVIRPDIWPPTCPWLNTLWLSFVGSLRDKMCTTNPYNWEVLRNFNHSKISAVSEEELQRANIVFCSCTECIQSGGQHFEHLL